MTKPRWKRVGTHGQPPPNEYVHVRQTVGELARVMSVGNKWSNDTLYLTDDDLAALLPSPDDIEPAPLPEPWRPMDELPDAHTETVLIAWAAGGVTTETRTRHTNDGALRIAWAPLPEHPGGAS